MLHNMYIAFLVMIMVYITILILFLASLTYQFYRIFLDVAFDIIL